MVNVKTRKIKQRKIIKKIAINNGKTTSLNLEGLKVSSYEEIMHEITSVVGKRPSLPNNLPKGKWSEQALRVLSERYLVRDDDGEIIETPEEMCWRVAWEIASAEARWGKDRKDVLNTAKSFYKLLISCEFLPNSPTLMNAGTGNYLQYSACFVLPVEDSMEGIFDALKYQALIHKTGGGTGFAFSKLRPKGARVRSSSGTASGPVSFMRIFDAATNEVKQGGKRRGANMGILRIDHPDILEFIHCKEEGGITNFNISVAITDKFMEAYEKDGDYDLIDPRTGEAVSKLSAKKVFDEIAEAAWRSGDPGLLFIDKINDSLANPIPSIGPIEATNPCGEQPLYSFDACNLGSIFLTYFVKHNGDKNEVDWEKLREVTRLSVRFLDDVIEVNPVPLEQIRKTVFGIRRIGLGIGGWADMLVDLGIAYDSEEALELAEEIMTVIQEEAVEASCILAKERGPFPLLPISIYKNDKPRRNSTVTTIAPTGSISIIAGSSSGIEPLFAIAFQHIVKDKHLNRTLAFFNPKFEEIMKKQGIWSKELKDKVAELGIIRDIVEIPENIRKVFVTAHEIHHHWHIKMQSAFQKHTENAVSKTINMSKNISAEEVKESYTLAWRTGCRGVTVFRDGCKDTQVLNLGVKEKDSELNNTLNLEKEWTRPMKVEGATYKIKTPIGTAFITVNQDEEGSPIEVFINVGKAGSDVQAMAEALGRVISKSLKFGSQFTAKERAITIIDQLKGIGGRRSVGFGPNKVLSLPDAVAMALSSHLRLRVNGFSGHYKDGEPVYTNGEAYNNGNGKLSAEVQSDLAGAVMSAQNPARQEVQINRTDDHTTASAESNLISAGVNQLSLEVQEISPKVSGDICPSCGAISLVYEEGCLKCYSCGHSEC